MTMDRILIEGLSTRCIVGVNHDERRERQDVLVSIELHADLKKPCATDDLGDSIDYKEIKKKVLSFVEDSQFQLIEALAESVAGICLEHPLVQKVKVRVDKPCALRFAKTVGVEITRGR